MRLFSLPSFLRIVDGDGSAPAAFLPRTEGISRPDTEHHHDVVFFLRIWGKYNIHLRPYHVVVLRSYSTLFALLVHAASV